MNLKLPNLPLWAVVALVAAAGAASVGAEFLWPRHAYGPALEARAGFYAGAGFGAALIVLAAGWVARFLRDDAPGGP